MKSNVAALSALSDPHHNHQDARGRVPMSDGRPIDLVHLTRQTFGDKRLETELLRLFVRQSLQIGKGLESAGTQDEQAATSVELLHMLSGSARAIGATAVATAAGGFEARMRLGGATVLDAADVQMLSGLIALTNRYIGDLLDQG